jgi:hypothetical protein
MPSNFFKLEATMSLQGFDRKKLGLVLLRELHALDFVARVGSA